MEILQSDRKLCLDDFLARLECFEPTAFCHGCYEVCASSRANCNLNSGRDATTYLRKPNVEVLSSLGEICVFHRLGHKERIKSLRDPER